MISSLIIFFIVFFAFLLDLGHGMHRSKKWADPLLRELLKDAIPKDAVEKCENRLSVTVTKVWPPKEVQFSTTMISKFSTIDHIVDSVTASSFIPGYSCNQKICVPITQNADIKFIDGGFTAFMPPNGDLFISAIPKELLLSERLMGPFPDICPRYSNESLHHILWDRNILLDIASKITGYEIS